MSQAVRYRGVVALCLLASFIAGIALAIGFLAGRYRAERAFKKVLSERSASYTLAPVAMSRKHAILAAAYQDAGEFAASAHTYSWNVPMVMTPFVGSAPSPGKNHNAHINTLQFRSPTELTIPKPRDEFRIFLTGGSTAFGTGAPRQEATIGGYLERFLNERYALSTGKRFRVYTGANPAWASTHERILIENRISELEPDLVISLSGINDVHWGHRGRNILWFRTYEDELQWILLNGVRSLSGHEPMPDAVQVAPHATPAREVASRLVKNVRLAAHALALNRAPYVFALQPAIYVTHAHAVAGNPKEGARSDYFSGCYQEIREVFADAGIDNCRFVDLSGAFRDYPDHRLIYLDSYHFGDRGNLIVAQALLASIRPFVGDSPRPVVQVSLNMDAGK